MPDTALTSPTLLDDAGARALLDGYPKPSPLVLAKDIGRIDDHIQRFIEMAPFYCIATSNAEGHQDVTPRGDPPGSFKVLGPNLLALPDRPGNNRLDTLRNLVENPNVGLIFLIPGIGETVRVNGTARLSADPQLLASMAVEGKLPKAAIVVTVRQAFLHCAKAFHRAKLWRPEAQVTRTTLPSLAKMLGDQIGLTTEQQKAAEERTERAYRDGLWAPLPAADTVKVDPPR
ncbi:MAG: pyridoxamine 5'-phosphate oxidase family protein [Alphaproteobacteria bacterium]|nr:pyridoxamine 5'-phosphate oxidase family protein [Alphaproteobacteria bacterium]